MHECMVGGDHIYVGISTGANRQEEDDDDDDVARYVSMLLTTIWQIVCCWAVRESKVWRQLSCIWVYCLLGVSNPLLSLSLFESACVPSLTRKTGASIVGEEDAQRVCVCVCVCVWFLISVLSSWLPGTCRWQIVRVCCDSMTVVVVIHASWWKEKVHRWRLLVIVHHDELVLFFVSLLSSSFLQFLHSGVDHPNG